VTTLETIVGDPPSGRARAVLLDGDDYAQRVLLQGRTVPWDEPMAYAHYFGQAQDLLGPDAALLSLGPFCARRIETDGTLQSAMRARTRSGSALRALLANDDLIRRAVELVTLVARTQRRPVVLQVPSPRWWLARTHPFSGELTVEGLSVDDAENASMYVADWLRRFAGLPLAAVVLDDRDGPGDPPTQAVPLPVYSPVAGVTEHYRWTLALRHADHVELHGSAATGAVIPQRFWLEDDVPVPEGDFLLGEIPATAIPEDVLHRLSGLGRLAA